MASRQQAKIIAQAAARYRIPARVLWGVYGTETNFGQNKNTSSAGARGPFQFMPGTAKSLGIDPYNFKQAAFGAAKYLSQYKGRGLAGMLSAYNAGPGGSIQPGYVASVRKNAQTFPAGVSGGSGGDSGGQDGLSVLLRQGTGTTAPTPADMTAVNLLAQGLQKPAPPPLGQLPQPSFSAQAPMPQGAQPLPSVGSPAPQGPTLDDQLQAVAQIQGQVPSQPDTSLSAVIRNGGEMPQKNGSVKVASNANRAGVGIKPVVMDYLSNVAGRVHRAITVGTGTNHNRLTVDGNVSDHWDGHAADIPVPIDSHQGDVIAAAALEQAGLSRSRARADARRGGLFTINSGGHRIQVIWKTNAGGNHHNHVHIGIR